MEVSPEKWRESSIHGIKLAHVIIERSDREVSNERINDPLPQLRDVCIKQSNDRIRNYMRATRAVVVQLRKSFAALNDEIKSINRSKESLEKALEHKRKDIVLNLESQELRACRPVREKDPDLADNRLKSEHSQLLALKRSLESHLCRVQLQLQEMSAIRSRLAAVTQERARVTDLLGQSVSFDQCPISFHEKGPLFPDGRVTRSDSRPVSVVNLDSRPSTRSSYQQGSMLNSQPLTRSSIIESRPSTRASFLQEGRSGSVMESRPVTRDSLCSRQKAYSAPVPLELGLGENYTPEMQGGAEVSRLAGPYDALSAESIHCMSVASDAVLMSREIRQEAACVIDHTHRLQQVAHGTVDMNLTKKIAHTVTLTDHLGISAAETKLSHQRSQRQYNSQQKALGYLLGPVSAMDVATCERLDRPVVKLYQRHVGSDLPEAAHLIQATETYRNSMDATMKNMALLKLAHKSIKADIKDKKKATFLDSDVVRLRRKTNHRWVLRGKAYIPTKKVLTEPI